MNKNGRLKELLSNQHWMIHDLVDGDQITNEDEEILYALYSDAKTEMDDFISAVDDITKSYECYSALHKPETEWDEYDYMMYPKWKKLLEILEKIK